jgi:hypothetical protein
MCYPGDSRAIGQQRLKRILRQLAAQELALPMAQVQGVPLRSRHSADDQHLGPCGKQA